MIAGIVYVIAGIFWAFVCGEEVRKKNYDPTAWYVLGFIFGGLAYLVAWWFIKPKIRQYHFGLQRMEHMDPDRKAYWICILLIWIGRLRL